MPSPTSSSSSLSSIPTTSPITSQKHLRHVTLSIYRLIACTSAMAGIQLCYAVQINLGTAHLMSLGLEHRMVSLAWLAGPLSGLLVQPLVGLASDNCTSRFGRRRPFLLIGAILSSISLILFAFAQPLTQFLFPSSTHTSLSLAIAAFFLLDFSIQAIQAPLRALLTDVLPSNQLARGNAYIGFFTGLGNLLGGLLSSLPVPSHLPHVAPVQPVSVSAAVILLFCVCACIFSTPETPYRKRSSKQASTITDTLLSVPDPNNSAGSHTTVRLSVRKRLFRSLAALPRPFWRVFCIQLCTWCGFFTLFVYVNTWVATNVFGGKHGKDPVLVKRYMSGIHLGAKANALTALCTIMYSLLLPKLLVRFGITPVYAFSQIVEAVCLLAAPFIRIRAGQTEPSLLLKIAVTLDIASFGIVWATTMGVPWTLIGNALEADPRFSSHLGLLTTLFNASQSFPQLIVAFIAPLILTVVDDSSFVMFAGGICATIGALLVLVLKVGPDEGKESKRRLNGDVHFRKVIVDNHADRE